jgi:hypothetical protein
MATTELLINKLKCEIFFRGCDWPKHFSMIVTMKTRRLYVWDLKWMNPKKIIAHLNVNYFFCKFFLSFQSCFYCCSEIRHSSGTYLYCTYFHRNKSILEVGKYFGNNSCTREITTDNFCLWFVSSLSCEKKTNIFYITVSSIICTKNRIS